MSSMSELHMIKMLLSWLRGIPLGYELILSTGTKMVLVDIPLFLLFN